MLFANQHSVTVFCQGTADCLCDCIMHVYTPEPSKVLPTWLAFHLSALKLSDAFFNSLPSVANVLSNSVGKVFFNSKIVYIVAKI